MAEKRQSTQQSKQQDRQTKRRGHHVSIAGDPADETLRDLVAQFSDPYAFVRELIQNSLDAGAQRIEIRMAFDAGTLTVEVIDDGEGMDRATIEGYLLTLFRSTKEEDLTKIGKFGIGFVSLFAIGPREVIVETGRDAIWHRVVFDETRNYKLFEMADPFEGTTVRLLLSRERSAAQSDCQRIYESASRWCGLAEADITCSAHGIAQGWPKKPIARPFVVEAPLSITHTEDGLSAVLGPSRAPISGFYNQGLTLWEQQAALIPGVSFRVKANHLEHTLTRDNVMRDRHFERVMSQLNALAAGPLGDAVHEALAGADLARASEIFASISHDHPWQWRTDAGLFPTIDGRRASISELKRAAPGWLRGLWPRGGSTKHELLWATPDDDSARALAAKGHLVLAARSPDDAHLLFASELAGAELVNVHNRYFAPLEVSDDAPHRARFEQANALCERVGLPYRLHPARSLGSGPGGPRFAVCQQTPFAIEPVRRDGLPEGSHLLVDVQHPLYASLSELSPGTCAPLLVRAALLGASVQSGPLDRALIAEVTR